MEDSTRTAVRAPAPEAGPPDAPRPTGRRLLWRWGPPLVAFLASNLMYAVAAARGGYHYLDASVHTRFDSVQYLGIADRGYEMFSCGVNARLAANYGADSWCGNAGWFPLYSGLVALLRRVTGLSLDGAGFVVTELATLSLVLLAWWALSQALPAEEGQGVAGPGSGRDGAPARTLAVLALVLLIPGAVYFHANFPMSLAVAASMAYVLFLARRRWVAAGLAGALATAAYPIGGLVAVVGLVAVGVLVARRRLTAGRAVGVLAAVCALPAAGMLAVFAVLQVTVGHWNGYFLIQEHYSGGRGHNPVGNFRWEVARPARVWVVDPDPHLVARLHETVRLSIWVALALVLLVVAAAVVGARRDRLTAVDAGLTVFMVAMFVAPLVVGNQVVQYRSHTLLVPGLLVLRHLPAWLLWPLVVLLVPLAYRMGTLFFPSLLT
ncbi:hypothetical protein ACFO0M_15805 [Micromonospora mangrovi]|uniref:Mannosyltransferase PIG-V n=2 Tax=Micromonospora TaxID=1873 RepID=A0AAU8HGM8_9ACTN